MSLSSVHPTSYRRAANGIKRPLNLLDLPVELIENIFSYSHVKDLLNVVQVLSSTFCLLWLWFDAC